MTLYWQILNLAVGWSICQTTKFNSPPNFYGYMVFDILCWFMSLTTPTHLRAFNGQGSTTSECSAWLKTAYRSGNHAPTRGEEWFLCLFVLIRSEWSSQCRPRLFYSGHVHGMSWICQPTSIPPPYPAFIASAKPIFKNRLRQLITCGHMQSDDAKKHLR